MQTKSRYIRKPDWLRGRLLASEEYGNIRRLVVNNKLNTVCEEARCPNIEECWGKHKTATFMILGSICTRRCRFCSVDTGLPTELDFEEPKRIAFAVEKMQLRHVVITMVARDDLNDGGATICVSTIEAIRKVSSCTIELLASDFGGSEQAIISVLRSCPDILSHNIETIRRLTPVVRSNASYDRTLNFFEIISGEKTKVITKSSLMVGLGENTDEVYGTLSDLRKVDVKVVNIGQYLQPTSRELTVYTYWHPDEFLELRQTAKNLGFMHCESGPFVRSSYHADKQLEKLIQNSHSDKKG